MNPLILTNNKTINYTKFIKELSVLNLDLNRVEKGFGDTIEIHFNSDFTGDITPIQNVLNAHDGNIYNYKLTGTPDDPRSLNYNIFCLNKNKIFQKGLLKSTEYYRNFDNDKKVFSDLILIEYRNFIIDKDDILDYRISRAEYYLENGLVGEHILEWNSYYSFEEKIEEQIKRRTNIISDAKKYLLYFLETIDIQNGGNGSDGNKKAKDFALSLTSGILVFVNGFSNDVLKNSIQNTSLTYITQEMKDELVRIIF
jgi:hypothetical protein